MVASMNVLNEYNVNCPYCGEQISVLIDCSVEQQEYVEDCQVCCRPITFKIQLLNSDEVSVTVLDENEV